MIPSITHFEIYREEPAKLADFYRNVFGWQIEQMPGVSYWRIQTDKALVCVFRGRRHKVGKVQDRAELSA